MNQCERELSELSTELQMFRLASESFQITHSDGSAVVESRISRFTDVVDDSLVRIVDVEAMIGCLQSDVAAPHSSSNDSHQLSTEVGELRSAVSQVKDRVQLFESRIVSSFSPLFAEFDTKRFQLLWRGNRDGFTSSEFHHRCCGHENTLTIIEDTKGNIFGDFTPLK
jgi:hypothetical protein